MAKRIGSYRRKTRDELTKPLRTRGKLSLRKFFQKFEIGEQVVLKMDPTYQEGNYHQRFHGRHGIVSSQQGKCFFVAISDQGKPKSILVHPVHLKKV
jgi:large subunit ribosomal protein L21e